MFDVSHSLVMLHLLTKFSHKSQLDTVRDTDPPETELDTPVLVDVRISTKCKKNLLRKRRKRQNVDSLRGPGCSVLRQHKKVPVSQLPAERLLSDVLLFSAGAERRHASSANLQALHMYKQSMCGALNASGHVLHAVPPNWSFVGVYKMFCLFGRLWLCCSKLSIDNGFVCLKWAPQAEQIANLFRSGFHLIDCGCGFCKSIRTEIQ